MYKTIDLFAGIGGIRLGFESYGCENIFSSEWDKDAQKMYAANFGEIPHGDINLIEPSDIPNHDILLAGFLVSLLALRVKAWALLIHAAHYFLISKKY